MSPTIKPGDLVLCLKTFRSADEYQTDEVVVFQPPSTLARGKFIQRIIALPGNKVHVESGLLHVNGVLVPNRNGLDPRPGNPQFQLPGLSIPSYPLTVPAGHVFVTGDNNTNSFDSRYFGPVRTDEISHRPWLIVRPPGRVGGLD